MRSWAPGEMGIGTQHHQRLCHGADRLFTADEAVGKGGGLTDQGLDHKKK